MSGLRISINTRRVEGPFGGGNRFGNDLEDRLAARGHTVWRHFDADADLVLLASSENELSITSFPRGAVRDARVLGWDGVVVHRVNTADEPRGMDAGINRAVLKTNRLADHTVFVSGFVRDLFLRHGMEDGPHTIITNGADAAVFRPDGVSRWDGTAPLRVVTHHWSPNYLKGFDIYERLDQLLRRAEYRSRFEFSCIGNVPLGVELANTRVVEPLEGPALAAELKRHHLYLTAARHEPGPNHVVEAMACGLPVLYLESGALPEYCAGRGLGFQLWDFERRLEQAREDYDRLIRPDAGPPPGADEVADRYEALFRRLVAERPAAARRAGVRARLGALYRQARRRLGDGRP